MRRRIARGLATAFAIATLAGACELVSVTAIGIVTVSVQPDDFQIVVGQQRQLSVILTDQEGRQLSGHDVTWSSENPGIALIEANGTVHGNGPGRTRITARADGVSGEAFVTVTTRPSIDVSNSTVVFDAVLGGSQPPSHAVQVSSQGPAVDRLVVGIAHQTGEPAGWLSATLSALTPPTELRLTASPQGLPEGTYHATVTISANGTGAHDQADGTDAGAATVDVELVVGPAVPVIAVDKTVAFFSMQAGAANPAAQTIAVTNTGAGTLTGLGASVQYQDGVAGWLSATLSPQTAPSTLTLSVSGTGLQAGVYSATVDIVASAAANSPLRLAVTLEVLPPAVATAPPRSVLARPSATR